jgi:hypothetical protein
MGWAFLSAVSTDLPEPADEFVVLIASPNLPITRFSLSTPRSARTKPL